MMWLELFWRFCAAAGLVLVGLLAMFLGLSTMMRAAEDVADGSGDFWSWARLGGGMAVVAGALVLMVQGAAVALGSYG